MAGVRGTRAPKSGLGREVQAKVYAKYNPEQGQQCLLWLHEVVNSNLNSEDLPIDFDMSGDLSNFVAVLKDGFLLARLANALIPGSVAAKKCRERSTKAFVQMELIGLFVKMAKDYGVTDIENFQTVDLYENQNPHQVVVSIQSLGRKAQAKGLLGFGPKEATANRRVFSKEVLQAGHNVIGLQMGTNKGASQAGMTFGKQRMIID